MSSQLDYWREMNAKNAELASRQAHDTQNAQHDKQTQDSRGNYNAPQNHPASLRTSADSFRDRSSRSSDGMRSARNTADPYTLDSRSLQGKDQYLQSSLEASSTRDRISRDQRLYSSEHEGARYPARQSSRRTLRDNRTLRSQDYLRSRDDYDDTGLHDFAPNDPLEPKTKEFSENHRYISKNADSPKGTENLHAARSSRAAASRVFASRDAITSQDATSDNASAFQAAASHATTTSRIASSDASLHSARTKSSQESPKDARKLGKSYLPGLDGLRCIAVLAVLLYHISPNQFIGGYIGVDLFFVISGFLITYRNLQNIQNPNKKFTLKNFWLRRARRLIPALVLVILVCVPIGAIIYPDILVGAFRQVAGALTYSTNWVEIIHGSNYFDQANPSLFKNFWSLAVEEQFYIIWPPLLLLLLSRRLKNSQLITIVATIAVASMVLMGILAAPDNYTRVYYGTDTHCFGLAMGIIFAFIWNKEKGSLSKEWLSAQPWIPALAPVGLIGFALIVMLVPDTAAFTYPFGLVLGSLFSLFLVGAVIIRPDTLFTRIMELAPLRWLGVRSYGIYLWHWPMLVFGRILIPTAMGTVENVAVDVLFAFISFVAADLSYRFVEEPMRKDGFIKSLEKLVDRARDGIVGRVQAGVCVVLVIATIIAIATAPAKTQLQMQIEQQQAEQAQQAQEAQQNNTEGGSPQDPGSIPNYDESQMKGIPDSSTITAIGDSLISGNSIGFEEEFPEINFLAEPIRQWEQGVEVVKEGNQQGLIRQNVILDFGTNGGVADEDLVRQVLDELGPNRRILLYNIYSPSTFVDEANEIYEKFAEEYPNVYLVDWNSVASAHPEYLLSDRTHTNIEGQNAFVAAAKEVFEES